MTARFPPVDFGEFHRRRAPDLLAGNGELAGADVSACGPLALRVGDEAFTYAPAAGSVEIRDGEEDADTVAILEPGVWTEFAHELRSCFGLMIGDVVSFDRGDFSALIRWEPALRAIWHGRPIYDEAAAAQVVDLDLTRAFTPDDADADMAGFLSRAGFLRVRGVFTEHEMDALAEDVERVRSEATYDDGRSWWAKNTEGSDVCCRLIYAGEKSEVAAMTAADERLTRYVALAGADVRLSTDRLDGESVVIKNPDVVEGLSDLPWHRDCGMGGHPVLCPGINVGVQVDGATADNGQLHFLAGSQGSSTHMPSTRDVERLPVQAVETERGDVTVHIGHVLHAAPPPAGHLGSLTRGRRTMYATFVPPLAFEVVPPGHGYNDAVLEKRGRVAL
ncbi:MAG: phytanoyl-CoA dioxygenase family protein [Actinobacteria bacterium]|nr:phytanoyl-CoA dioxygenase family protein [Actinomycetota bacterium]